MNQINRFCTQQGHEQYQVSKVCTYKSCVNRWCCSQCLNGNIHKHSMRNTDHIMNQEQLSNKVKQDIDNLKKEYLKRKQLFKEFKVQEKQVNDNWISDEDNFKLSQLIQKVEGQYFIQLNDEDINKLLNINQCYFNNDVQLQLQDIQNEKLDQENINNQIIDFKSRQYDKQKIYEKDKGGSLIFSSLISRNEQYLVYGVRGCQNIYDLKKNKVYKKLQKQYKASTLQFTDDSKILFAGASTGFVYGYFVKIGFKTFYKQQIHSQSILQIIVQQQCLITASVDASIIKTNFINKNQMFKLVGHSDFIFSIDYDNLKDIMISTSRDKTLKIWDCLNQNILIDHNFKEYGYIQLINNKQDIIRCDYYCFQKFTIDYQNQKLLQTFSQQFNNEIFGFQSAYNDQNLLLIFSDHCKILNNEGELITNIYHNVDLYYRINYICYQEQLDNLNYIVLQDSYKLFLLRVKNEKN